MTSVVRRLVMAESEGFELEAFKRERSTLPAISVAAALEPAQARVAYPTKVAEWLTLAPLAASSAVMFYFRCCNVLQDISLFNAARTVGGNNEAAALPRVGGLMPGPHQF